MSDAGAIPEPFPRHTPFALIDFRGAVLHVKLIGPAVGQREAPIISRDIAAVLQHIGRSFRAVVLDLADVRVMTSMGLGMCIDIRHRAQAMGAGTILYGATPALADLLRVMKVDRLCTIAGDSGELDGAVAA